MASLLLAIIYLAFISLGLPDSLLGSAWPSMYQELEASVSWAGIISMIISGSTIVSSLFSGKVIGKLGTAKVMVLSTAMTALALMGFSMSRKFFHLCLWAVPYGLGAGSVDAALNNYVALHYRSRHMSWLHCFWGLGATMGPYIMGWCLTRGLSWNTGYQIVGIIQIVLTTALFASLPLWKGQPDTAQQGKGARHEMTIRDTVGLPGAKALLVAFFCYSALEATAGMWASSYMVLARGISEKTAAKWASLFYMGITLGRLASGFITERLGDRSMVRLGQILAGAGVVCLLIPGGSQFLTAGLLLTGIGCAPIYPCLLHSTPGFFGAENSQSIMGILMAFAYVGSTFMPPLFGVIGEQVSIQLYPVCLLFFVALMALMSEQVNRRRRAQER